MYFNYNEEEPKIHHKVFILNQEPKFTITSPLGLLEKTIEIVAKIICKKHLECGLLIISKLFLIYKYLMYGTNINIKRHICIL